MLLTLGLLLLLTPFPSLQTPTNEKRNSTGSDTAKPNVVIALSKPQTPTNEKRNSTGSDTAKPNVVIALSKPQTPTNEKRNSTGSDTAKPNVVIALSKPQTPTNEKRNSTGSDTAKPNVVLALSKPQTPTNEKRNSTGSDTAKPNVVLALSKQKTTGTLVRQMVKQTARPTPRPSAVNQTGLTASTANQKTLILNTLKNTKDKPISAVIMATSKPATVSTPKIIKNKPTASANQTVAIKSPTNAKEKPAPAQPIKVVISTDCDTNGTKEQELTLRPGAPLVMTHRISLIPAGCTGGCVAEMAALKGRVLRLEKEMTSLKQKCPCSEKCQNDCSANGKCEKGKCVCVQGFLGPDCNRCAPGANCNKKNTKEKVKLMVETVTLQVNQESNAINTQGKKTKVEQTLFQKKDQRKGTEAKEVDTKTKLGTSIKVAVKTSTSKTTVKGSAGGTKITRPTVGQVLLKQVGRKHEEARKGKTAILTGKKLPTVSPATFNKTRPGKETLEQSTLAEKNVTQSPAKKVIKKVKAESVNATKVVQSVDNTKIETSRTGSAKGKTVHQSQYMVNVTMAETTNEVKVSQTSVQTSVNVTRRAGGTGLGSVRVENITSHSFTLTWTAPNGMFKNFTVSRTEHRADGEEEEEEEEAEEGAFEGVDKAAAPAAAKNASEVQVQSESTNGTASSSPNKAPASRGKAEGKRVSMVLPGGVRSVEFGNLRPQTRYAMHIFGTALGKRSKIHRVTVTTGPEPATELLFSNVTESSLTVSWSKPKSTFTGFKVTYTLSNTGESSFVTVLSQQSYVVLSKLTAGTSYTISVTTMQGKVQSDALSSTITTVPAPPIHLQVINVTDTRTTLQWTPSLGKVDRFIISYESSKTPNVTVTVMVSGNSIEHQLRGLARGTLYIVKVLSQKDSLQSMAISTTFTTASAVKASEVGARSAVVAWKAPTVAFHSYRLTYQVIGEETKEVILDHTVTEYKLTGLLSMSRYIVLVQGEREGRYTSVVTTDFITGKLRFPFPTECSQELLNGALQSGEVDIYPGGKEGGAIRVYCDMETEGGGWTVFQRRMNGKLDFFRTWNDYSVGFGNLSEEFWLGNELLHNLSSLGPVSLRVDLISGRDVAYAHYSNFTIDSEEKHYAIMVSGYTGTAGDSMRYHNGRPFSTRDKDPNPLGIHCARAYMGGWWYKNCYKTNLNGLYGTNSNNQGVVWIDWKGKDSSIPFSEMKFRPAGFSPATHG